MTSAAEAVQMATLLNRANYARSLALTNLTALQSVGLLPASFSISSVPLSMDIRKTLPLDIQTPSSPNTWDSLIEAYNKTAGGIDAFGKNLTTGYQQTAAGMSIAGIGGGVLGLALVLGVGYVAYKGLSK